MIDRVFNAVFARYQEHRKDDLRKGEYISKPKLKREFMDGLPKNEKKRRIVLESLWDKFRQ